MVAKKSNKSTILRRTVRRFFNLPTALPLSVYHFWVTLSTDNIFMRGIKVY